MSIVTLDFETFGPCDLSVVGAWRYSEDPRTEILSLVYHFDGDFNGHFYQWRNNANFLYNLAENPAVSFRSHGNFEQAVWANVMVPKFRMPPIGIERWIDTMASCALYAIPLDLDAALRALKLPIIKDMEGKKLVVSLSRINKKTGQYPERTPEIMEKVYEYNRIDVEGTCALGDALGGLPDDERKVWEIDQKINQRGVQLDMRFVRAAQLLIARETLPLMREFRELTGLNPTQRDKVLGWLKTQGVHLKDYTKETVAKALGALEDDADQRAGDGTSNSLSENAQRALYIRSLVSSASIKKLSRMERSVCADGRARGLLQYHAATTGRWAGRGIQPQNLPRGSVRGDPDELVADIIRGDSEQIQKTYGVHPIEAVVSALRHAFVARDGCVLVSADYVGIEARVVLALAGQHDKVEMLARGKDVYSDMASMIYGRPITKADMEQRQVGKNTVLGCGFGLGWEKFIERYLQHFDPEYAEVFARRIINSYRYRWAPRVRCLWNDLELTALRAMHNPGQLYKANCGIVYGRFKKYLVCQLFDGKCLYYYSPEIVPSSKYPDITTWRYRTRGHSTGGKPPDSDLHVTPGARESGIWVWEEAYGGLLTENVVQALARQLLCRALERFDLLDMPVVLTVHDEIVLELPDDRDWTAIVSRVMCESVGWAEDIRVPVSVETWQGKRYRK